MSNVKNISKTRSAFGRVRVGRAPARFVGALAWMVCCLVLANRAAALDPVELELMGDKARSKAITEFFQQNPAKWDTADLEMLMSFFGGGVPEANLQEIKAGTVEPGSEAIELEPRVWNNIYTLIARRMERKAYPQLSPGETVLVTDQARLAAQVLLLARSANADAATKIRALLEHRQPEIARAATLALGLLGNPKGKKQLSEQAKGLAATVDRLVMEGRNPFNEQRVDDWEKEGRQVSAALALGYFGDYELLEALLDFQGRLHMFAGKCAAEAASRAPRKGAADETERADRWSDIMAFHLAELWAGNADTLTPGLCADNRLYRRLALESVVKAVGERGAADPVFDRLLKAKCFFPIEMLLQKAEGRLGAEEQQALATAVAAWAGSGEDAAARFWAAALAPYLPDGQGAPIVLALSDDASPLVRLRALRSAAALKLSWLPAKVETKAKADADPLIQSWCREQLAPLNPGSVK